MKTLITISQPPIGTLAGKEALDLGLVCAAFEQEVILIFVDRGVHYLRQDLAPEILQLKNLAAQIKGLEFYEIEQVIAEEESLLDLGLTQSQLFDNVTLLSRQAIKELAADAHYQVIL